VSHSRSAYAITAQLVGPMSPGALFAYHLWLFLFYGGMLVAAFTISQRSKQLSSLLHATALVRGRSETLLAEVRGRALQSRLDPALVLETLRELEQRYRSSPERAEKLLESLVEYLRCAIPGPSQPSTPVAHDPRASNAQIALVMELAERTRDLSNSDSEPKETFS
jgi:hypothetical protein